MNSLKKIINILPIVTMVLLYLSFVPGVTGLLVFVAFIPLLYFINESKRSFGVNFFIVFFSFSFFTLFELLPWVDKGGFAVLIYVLISWVIPSLLLPLIIKVNKEKKVLRYALFVSVFIIHEWLCQHVDVLIPTFLLKNTLADFAYYFQWIKLVGGNVFTIWILVVNILLFELIKEYSVKKVKILSIVILTPILLSSFYLISNSKEDEKLVRYLVINPNNDLSRQEYIDNPNLSISELLSKTEEYLSVNGNTDVVLWPETSSLIGPYLDKLDNFPSVRLVKDFISRNNFSFELVYGSIGFSNVKNYTGDIDVQKHSEFNEYFKTHNAAIHIDKSLNSNVFSKKHFLPFEENIPYPKLFSWIQRKYNIISGVPVLSEYLTNVNSRKIAGMNTSVILCYDAAFPKYIEKLSNMNDVILCLTNELWTNSQLFKRQYLNASVMSCVENNVSMIRCTNGGYDALINKDGSIQNVKQEGALLELRVDTNSEKSNLSFFIKKFFEIISNFCASFLVIILLFRNNLRTL